MLDDVDKVGLENPEMASLLIHQLQEIAAQGLETNQLGSAVAATRELAALLGIGANNRQQHLLQRLGGLFLQPAKDWQ